MYEFLDRFVSLAVPRIRDFKGLNPRAFDGAGNYNLGLKEQYIFPEVNVEKSDGPRGMNITFVTTAKTNKDAYELLVVLGLPFAKN
jgi:large subunit ribosomal protein L5